MMTGFTFVPKPRQQMRILEYFTPVVSSRPFVPEPKVLPVVIPDKTISLKKEFGLNGKQSELVERLLIENRFVEVHTLQICQLL